MVRDKGDNMNKIYKNLSNTSGRKGAFTLAEALIALAIIGIVALLTMPRIVSNVKHYTLQNQFKEAHSLLQKAFVNIRAENPNLFYEMKRGVGGYDQANTTLKPLLIKELHIKGDYGKNGLISNFSKYKNYYNKVSAQSNWGSLGQIMLKNGMIVFTECSYSCTAAIHIFVDINGLKGPNRCGHDLFHFQVNDNVQLVPGTWFGKNCNLGVNNKDAGFDCTQQAINDPNYFKNLP